MDFELILTVLTVITFGIWLLDKFWRIPGRYLVDLGKSLFPIFLIVLLLRSFLYEPFLIPSSSLEPTLLPGDFVLVNKYDYGLRLPVLRSKIMEIGEPERGDIMVFRYPDDPKINYIKRVIGLPGDTISYVDKVLTINGIEAPQTLQEILVGTTEAGQRWPVLLKQEDLLGLEHGIYQFANIPPDNIYNIKVPEGAYFVLGDNRDDSKDSRAWGFVPEQNIVGKAVLIWMSWKKGDFGVRWSRIGDRIN